MADIKIKEYLTFDEMKTIVDALGNEPDVVMRTMLKDIYLLKFVTDIEIPDEVNSTLYDEYMADGTIERVYMKVKNISTLDAMIKETFSVDNVLYRFASALTMQLSQMAEQLSVEKIKETLTATKEAIEATKR